MVEFHYRWHPYYGGRFRHEGREDRANGAIIRVEIRPGEIIQVAEWMLDSALCADMEMGEPRVAVIGLVELHGLLTHRGFRQTSTDALTAIQEARHEGTTTTLVAIDADPAAEHAARYAADARPAIKVQRADIGEPFDQAQDIARSRRLWRIAQPGYGCLPAAIVTE